MMDFMMHGLWNCVVGVGKDLGVMGFDEDSGHGTWSSLISSHGMWNSNIGLHNLVWNV